MSVSHCTIPSSHTTRAVNLCEGSRAHIAYEFEHRFFLSKCGERNFDWFMSTAHSCNFLSTKLTHTYESYENLIGIFRDNRITMSGNGFVQNLKETGHIFT